MDFAGVYVYSYQFSRHYLQPDFFLYLTYYCLNRRLAFLHSAAGQIPQVYITPMAQQDVFMLIQNNAKRPYFNTAPDPLLQAMVGLF